MNSALPNDPEAGVTMEDGPCGVNIRMDGADALVESYVTLKGLHCFKMPSSVYGIVTAKSPAGKHDELSEGWI